MNNITIENARIMFRNFAGKEGKFNPAGRRNFCVFLDVDAAEGLKADGWNIKYLQGREEDDIPQPILQVTVNYDFMPPKLWVVTKRGKTLLDEDSVSALDWAELENVVITIRPYEWEVNGKTGVKAYIKSGYFTIREDELDDKYGDIPDNEGLSYRQQSEDEEDRLPFK